MLGIRIIQLFLVTVFFTLAGFLPKMNWEGDGLFQDQEWHASQLVIESLVPQEEAGELELHELGDRLHGLTSDIMEAYLLWLDWMLSRTQQVIDADSR